MSGTCLVHGSYAGLACPTCSTAASIPFPYYPQPADPPTVTWNQNGWKCPSCGAGVAPFMPYCPYCAPNNDAPATTETNT